MSILSEPPPILGDNDDAASPIDAIRELVLASGGVSEDEANLLLTVLRQLQIIEATQGRAAARLAADRVRQAWLAEPADERRGRLN